MASYKEPSFKDRAALSAQAKQAALEKLKAKPPIDPAVAAERAAARAAKEAAEAQKRADKKAAMEQARLDKIAKAEAAKLEAEQAVARSQMTEAEKKAARDARCAARKARKQGFRRAASRRSSCPDYFPGEGRGKGPSLGQVLRQFVEPRLGRAVRWRAPVAARGQRTAGRDLRPVGDRRTA